MSDLTPNELARLFPNASKSCIRANILSQDRDSLSGAKPECPVRHESVATASGEAKSARRFRIHIESRRKRLIDPDNLVPKYAIDCLRYARIVQDDSAKDVEITVGQTKVGNEEKECTVMTVNELFDL